MAIIDFPMMYVADPAKGRPLFNGQIFVGVPDLDPEIPANQVQLNVVQEDGTVIPVAQPFIIGTGGVPLYNGATVRLDVDGNYSFKVLDKNDAQTYYVANVFEIEPVDQPISDIEAAAIAINVLDSDITYDEPGEIVASYIYSPPQQKTYSVPASAIGETIVSVVGSTLTTDIGTYTLTPVEFQVQTVAELKAFGQASTQSVYCEERNSYWTLKVGDAPVAGDFGYIQSDTTGFHWEVEPRGSLSTYAFGYVDGFVGDLQPLLQAFDDYIQTTAVDGSIYFKGIGDIGSALEIGLARVTAFNLTNITFRLSLTTTFTDTAGAGVYVRSLKSGVYSGDITCICGDSGIGGRRQQTAIQVENAERATFNGVMRGAGAIRYGVRFESLTKTTLFHVNIARANYCGLRADAIATNIVDAGSSNSVGQTTSFDLDLNSEYVEVGDIIMATDANGDLAPTRVKSVLGNRVTVFPWLSNQSEGMTVKIATGGGVYTNGGDTSLITFGRIDVILNGVGFKNEALYPASTDILHVSASGIGLLMGRDRSSTKGGNIGNFYIEGGGNIDLAHVETSNAIDGFTVSGANEFVVPSLLKNCSGALPGAMVSFKTIYLPTLGGLDVKGGVSSPKNQSELNSTFGVSNLTGSTPTYKRNTGTVTLSVNEDAITLLGNDTKTFNVTGTGVNGNPTGTITLSVEATALADGWLVNGQSTIAITGLTNAIKITVYYNVPDKTMTAYSSDLILIT